MRYTEDLQITVKYIPEFWTRGSLALGNGGLLGGYHELEEADRLCHGNWIEIQWLRGYIDKLREILDENGIDYPES